MHILTQNLIIGLKVERVKINYHHDEGDINLIPEMSMRVLGINSVDEFLETYPDGQGVCNVVSRKDMESFTKFKSFEKYLHTKKMH